MHALAIAAPVVYFAALTANTIAWGLPLSHDQLFLWILFGLAAMSLRAWRSWGWLLLEWLPLLGLLVLYDYMRGAVAVDPIKAHVWTQIDLDRWLFGGSVPTVWLQQHLGPFGREVHWWELGVSLVYLSHFVVPFAVGVWWWARDRGRWVWWRNRFLTLTALGLATYVLLPGVPPWLAAQRGELPPVQRTSGRGWSLVGLDIADRVLDLGRAAVNTTAALPSLHAAYAAFVAVACWRAARRPVRVLLVAYPVAMGFALVVSGEHYVIDVLLGWAYVAATIVLWRRIDVWLAARRLNSGRFVWPKDVGGTLTLSRAQFDALVLGLPWQRLAMQGSSA